MLDVLEDPKSKIDHSKIINHLKNFLNDTLSMSILCQRESFINYVIFQIQTFLKDSENKTECIIKYSIPENENFLNIAAKQNIEENEEHNNDDNVS